MDGTYHVFYQLNPHAPDHGDIHWGHHSSTDLLAWREEPIALRPRRGGIDAAECWSGSMVDDAGVPTAVYSAIPDHAQNAQVVLARGDRAMIEWVQDTVSQMAPPVDPGVADVRDPFVFTVEGRRFAVQVPDTRRGSSSDPPLRLRRPHRLDRARHPAHRRRPDRGRDRPGPDLECPNLIRVDGRWVLIVSLWRWVDDAHLLAGVRYLVGDLEPAGVSSTFTPTAGGSVDDGSAFYAPQCLQLSSPQQDDRVLLWGWAWELDRTPEQVKKAGWAGVLTFPRELYLDGDVLGSRPAAELVGLRGRTLDVSKGHPVDASAFEIQASGPVSLFLVDEGARAEVATTTSAGARILVDGSLVEIHDGPGARTTRAYPTATSRCEVDQAVVNTATAWELTLERSVTAGR